MPTTSTPSASSDSVRGEPMKPAQPVTRARMRRRSFLAVVSGEGTGAAVDEVTDGRRLEVERARKRAQPVLEGEQRPEPEAVLAAPGTVFGVELADALLAEELG